MLRVAVLVLTFALVSGVGLRAHERAEGDPLVSGGDNNALAPSTSPEKAAFQASKNYRVQLRDRAKPELQNLKKYYTNDWESDKNLLRYERDCLTDLAPKSLALRATAEDTEFCNSFQQTHKGFADSVRRVLAMLPLPSTRESIEAEMEAEMDEDEAAEDSSLLELETNAAIPGNPNLRWPTNKIPFCLDDSLEEDERVSFLWGVKHLQQNFHPSCITLELVKCDDEVHKVWVKHRKWRCFSAIGLRTSQARQRILWSDACDPGSAAHEMLHSLGFGHTMGRLDRDNYVTVDLTHVRKNRLYNFRKYNPPFQDYGPYDFGSILHYHDTMFIPFKKLQADSDIRSMRERLPRPPGVPEPLGTPWNGQAQREALSEADVSAVKMMYSCPASSAPVPSPAAAPAAGAPAEQTPPAAAVVTDVSSS